MVKIVKKRRSNNSSTSKVAPFELSSNGMIASTNIENIKIWTAIIGDLNMKKNKNITNISEIKTSNGTNLNIAKTNRSENSSNKIYLSL